MSFVMNAKHRICKIMRFITIAKLANTIYVEVVFLSKMALLVKKCIFTPTIAKWKGSQSGLNLNARVISVKIN